MTETVRNEQLKRALDRAADGYSVFPVKHGQKRPHITGWPTKATTDQDQIRKWWAEWPDADVGMPTGGDFCVIDLDRHDGQANGVEAWMKAVGLENYDLDELVVTAGGGYHIYRRTGDQFTKTGQPMPGVDLKSGGGFVVAYEGTDSLPPLDQLPELSDTEAKVLTASATSAETVKAADREPLGKGGVDTALEAALNAIHATPYGEQNNDLTKYSFAVGQLVGPYLSEADAWEKLEAALRHMEYPVTDPDKSVDTMERSFEAGMKDPRPMREPEGPEADFAKLAAPEDEPLHDSWKPRDLASTWDALAAGRLQRLKPEIMHRTDGLAMFYPGKTHSVAGEPGGAKSWLALVAAVEVLRQGGRVLYLDYEEDDDSTALDRLAKLGLTREQVTGLDYLNVDAPPRGEEFEHLLEQEYTLAVIDGVTGALNAHGIRDDNPGNNNSAIEKWSRALPRKLAARTGAAVVMVDHVTKNKENGGYPIGGQAKLGQLTGAAYFIEAAGGFGVGASGQFNVLLGKDRKGGVKGPVRDGGVKEKGPNKLLMFAEAEVESTVIEGFPHESISIRLQPPESDVQRDKELAEDFRRKIVQTVKAHPGIKVRELRTELNAPGGTGDKLEEPKKWLKDNGYIRIEPGKGNAQLHYFVKDYLPEFEDGDELAAPDAE